MNHAPQVPAPPHRCVPSPVEFIALLSKWSDGYRDRLDIQPFSPHHVKSDRFFTPTTSFSAVEFPRRGEVNLVVLSDHGMTSTDSRGLSVINLQHLIDMDDIQYMIYYGATSMLLPYEGKLEKVSTF
ncbi:hypothetical protein AVEN_72014-1 [Araneus ventricosus]|uniref:Ectonucleotide pyrophosphatase/phosphodiesterase family member 6 n=1 Tax=Araneus ventricosus TaxID=182803 RepID=A0A4Y2DFD3_ARAVE|nr:hypothetical protein AVEN_72014-1 [Araneus ventricosus]